MIRDDVSLSTVLQMSIRVRDTTREAYEVAYCKYQEAHEAMRAAQTASNQVWREWTVACKQVAQLEEILDEGEDV